MKEHPQADILRAIADGKTVQMRNSLRGSEIWHDEPTPFEYLSDDRFEWRVKPEGILINGIEVPCPVREPLKEDQECFINDICDETPYREYRWSSDNMDKRLLERGLIHLTKEAAVAHAETILSFTRIDK